MNFNFTVAVLPNNINVDTELQYIKSALLYADSIALISPVAYLYTLIMDDKNLQDERSALELLKITAPFIKASNEALFQTLDDYINYVSKILYSKNPKSIPFKTKLELKRILFKYVNETKSTIIGNIGVTQSQDISKLISSGRLDMKVIQNMLWNIDAFTPEYFRLLAEAIKTSYPIFDELSNNVMKAAVDAKVVNLSEFDKKKIQHAGISDNLLQQLPDFSLASIDEIVDIKKELASPLVRFRSKMLKFSDDIQTYPWDKDFEFECFQLYAREISPALLEIDELTKESRFLKNLGRSILSDDKVRKSIGGLVVSISAAGVFSAYTDVVSSATAITATSAAWAVEKIAVAYLAQQQMRQEIMKKDLYFYYQAGKSLRK